MMEDSWRWLLRERATERSRVLRTNSVFPLWERKRKISGRKVDKDREKKKRRRKGNKGEEVVLV